MDYILYCRKSTDVEDKQVMSLDAQEREMRILAQKYNINIVKTYRESMSAKDPGRPDFNEMLGLISKGKAQGVLAWKLDRLTRNLTDTAQLDELMKSGNLKELRMYDKVFLPTDNIVMFALESSMADQYSRDLSANVKRGNREKLNRGEWINQRPFGYIKGKDVTETLIDKNYAPFVKEMFELYATGKYSFREVADIMYEKGLRTKSGKKVFTGSIHRIINRTFYYGVMELHGKLYPGKYEPIITKELFDKCKEISKPKTRPRSQKHFFPYSGLMTCNLCSCAITAEKQKGYSYYHCTNGKGICNQKKEFVRGKELDKQIAGIFDRFNFDVELVEIMYKASLEKIGIQEDSNAKVVQTLEKNLTALQSKESRLVDTYTSSQISQELYDTKILDIQNERVNLNKQLEQARENNTNPLTTLERTKEVFLNSNRAKYEYMDSKPEQKRDIAFELLSNLTLEDRNIAQPSFNKPYDVLAKMPQNPTFSQLLPD